MTQFVLRCAAIAEMAAGTKQRFVSTALCPQPFLVVLVSDRQDLAPSAMTFVLKRATRARSLWLFPC
jgi:hypothetical protein